MPGSLAGNSAYSTLTPVCEEIESGVAESNRATGDGVALDQAQVRATASRNPARHS
jgi:hypothetical protein